MNLTPTAAQSESPKIQRTDGAAIQDSGVISRLRQPDNFAFWKAVNAVTFTQRGSGRRDAYRAVAYFCSLTHKRICNATVATQAARAGLSEKAMRRQLHGLVSEGAIMADKGVSRGRQPTLYRLPDDVYNPPVQPSREGRVNPPLKGVNKETIRSTSKAAVVVPVEEKQQQRIDGMLASCEISARALGQDFDTEEHRDRLRDSTLTIEDLQTFTNEQFVERERIKHTGERTLEGWSTSMTARYGAEYLARKRREKAASE